MLLLDRSPIELWRMLLPKKYILYPKNDYLYEELIFCYRNYVYFVHDDGSVVRMKKPSQLDKLDADDLWEILFHEKDTFDYDDHGIFTMGAILLDMGFLIPIDSSRGNENYQVEIINANDPESIVAQYEQEDVTFPYVLYRALIYCHECNEQEDGESEYEIRQITRMDYPLGKKETS